MSLIIENARLLNDEIIHILIEDKKIVKISKHLEDFDKNIKKIDINKNYISSGWIDSHTHSYPLYKPYSSTPDDCGYKQGVTTVIDAGTCGIDDIDNFDKLRKNYKTNVLAFLNISKIGLSKIDELSNMENIQMDELKKYLDKYSDFIVGLKARISKSIVKDNGIKPLELALDYIKNRNLKLMVHIGNLPPTIEEILELLGENTILSHYLNGKENGVVKNGDIIPEFKKALERGMFLDVGHGSASFSFKTARILKEKGIKLNLLSTDIYDGNRINGPVYSLSKVMTKFLYLGYSLEDVINSVTKIPAKYFNLKNTGVLEEGSCGDLTVFKIIKKDTPLLDSQGELVNFDKEIIPLAVVLNGEYIDIEGEKNVR